jgi:hypothetical protein
MARLQCVLAFRLKPFLLAFLRLEQPPVVFTAYISRRDLSEGRCLMYLALVSWRCSGIRPSPATGSRRQFLVPFFHFLFQLDSLAMYFSWFLCQTESY